MDPSYTSPVTQITWTLPREEEMFEQVWDLLLQTSGFKLERRTKEAMEEIEKMVSVSSNLNTTFKRSMRLAAVKAKTYVAELAGRSATTSADSDPQVGLLRSANEWLKKRLATCEGKVKALCKEVDFLRAGQVPHLRGMPSEGRSPPGGR